jgi:ABC-type bacteriocin/lantibiotic exporter with double-glycine peptidase domain
MLRVERHVLEAAQPFALPAFPLNTQRSTSFVIRLTQVSRRYGPIAALDNVSLEIAPCEFVAITGPSGCGKSTLMHLIGGLDQPTSGEIVVDGLALHTADDAALTDYRRRRLGIVFQFFPPAPDDDGPGKRLSPVDAPG